MYAYEQRASMTGLDFHQMVTRNTDNHETAFTKIADCVDTQEYPVQQKDRSQPSRYLKTGQSEDFRRLQAICSLL